MLSPQYGSQGTAQTLQELNAATLLPAFAVGAYANIEARTYLPEDPTTYFNGADFYPYLQQAIEGQAIFVASILVRDPSRSSCSRRTEADIRSVCLSSRALSSPCTATEASSPTIQHKYRPR